MRRCLLPAYWAAGGSVALPVAPTMSLLLKWLSARGEVRGQQSDRVVRVSDTDAGGRDVRRPHGVGVRTHTFRGEEEGCRTSPPRTRCPSTTPTGARGPRSS